MHLPVKMFTLGIQITLSAQRKRPGYVKAKIDVSIQEITPGICQEARFKHRLRIGKVKLKDVSAGVQVYTHSK